MSVSQKIITWQEYSKHITPQDCWVLVDGFLYDVSDYLVEHPGGDDILLKYSGIDASIPFNQQQHSSYAVSLRDARRVGKIETSIYTQQYRLMLQDKKKKMRQSRQTKSQQIKSFRENITLQEVARNNSQKSCWIIIQGKVYDVTNYISSHPGGQGLILDKAGRDATLAFKEANHSQDAITKRETFCIGSLQKSKKDSSSNLIFVVIIAILLIITGWALFGSAGQAIQQQ